MSTAPKAATFAVLLRVIFEAQLPGTFWLIWFAAALSMTLGNLGALKQNNIKRLLAYSSIAHAGYLLVAFASLPASGIPSAMFYTAAYAAMNVGAFAIISHIGNHGERYTSIDDYAGLGRRAPFLAAILTVFLLSLIGIPATGGFFAKFYVFSAALHSTTPLVGLTIIGVINSAIASYYYLRVVVVMYMKEPQGEAIPLTPLPAAARLVLVLSALFTLYLGILPGSVLAYAQDSVRNLIP
jgi:NADH-quinone oxidoreductase subunit N